MIQFGFGCFAFLFNKSIKQDDYITPIKTTKYPEGHVAMRNPYFIQPF